MGELRAVFRGSLLLSWLLIGVVLAIPFLRTAPEKPLTISQQALLSWWARKLVAIFAVSLNVTGEVSDAPIKVANHVSWLDIMVLMAVMPSRFLSKAEVAAWPVIGWLASRSGTVYMRRGQGETEHVLHHLGALVAAGDRVLFFPEGTTYAAEPGKFHARLFALAIALKQPIQPVSLVYHDGLQQRPDVAYVGEQSLMANLWHLLKQRKLQVDVSLLPSIALPVSAQRNLVSDSCQQAIRSQWLAVVSSLPRVEQ